VCGGRRNPRECGDAADTAQWTEESNMRPDRTGVSARAHPTSRIRTERAVAATASAASSHPVSAAEYDSMAASPPPPPPPPLPLPLPCSSSRSERRSTAFADRQSAFADRACVYV
jgi:hypothetical protein